MGLTDGVWTGDAGRLRGVGLGLAAAFAMVTLLLLLVPAPSAAARCKQPNAKGEPPCNPALPDSPWSATHRNSYAQASSPYRGLERAAVETTHIDLPGIPIAIQFSGRYPDGGRVAWGSLLDAADSRVLFKVDVETGELIDLYDPAEREPGDSSSGVGGITGAYNILDRRGRFIVPRTRSIDVYSDARRNRRHSPIERRRAYELPDRAFCGPDDRLVGATMTYDGFIAFATERGVVGTVPRQPGRMRDSELRTLSLNGSLCDDPGIDVSRLETVSNSIAADERGGIYVVTSKRMRRINHDAGRNRLESAWASRYDNGSENVDEIRLGAGSGSTPSLMGTGRGRDKFVAITDGQELMHLDLFWRGRVPGRWKGLRGDQPRRMACEYPVRFGDPNATASLSEQSIAVRGYGTFHVNNLLDYEFPPSLPMLLLNSLAALRGGDPAAAPYGVERIDWNPRRQRCHSVWANDEISVPNGVPSISKRSGLAYGIGQRDGVWGVEGIDWKRGRSRFFARASDQECSQQAKNYLVEGGLSAIFSPIIDELPRSCQNSHYAATEVGPGRSIWTGTFLGLTIYEPRR